VRFQYGKVLQSLALSREVFSFSASSFVLSRVLSRDTTIA
jgi:hypothetical protein